MNWIKEIPTKSLIEGEVCFLAKRIVGANSTSYLFHGRDLSGKLLWTQKPGLAIKALVDSKFLKILADDKSLVAIKIPADADKRWTKRKRK